MVFPTVRFRIRNQSKTVTPKLYAYVRLYGIEAPKFSTNISAIYPFDKKQQRFKSTNSEAASLNRQLEIIRADIINIFNTAATNGIETNSHSLRNEYLRSKEKFAPDFNIFPNYINTFISTHKRFATMEPQTVEKWKSVITFFVECFPALLLQDVETKHIDIFAEKLKYKKCKKTKVNSNDFVLSNLNRLKHFFIYAEKNGDILKNPVFVSEYREQEPEQDIHVVSFETIKRLEYLILQPQQSEIRDCFLVMFYTGFNYSDYREFSANPLLYIVGEHIEKKRYKNRKKKKNKYAAISITQQLRNILEKYNYQLPIFPCWKITYELKKMFRSIGFTDVSHVSTNLARRSLSTYALNQGVDIKVVSDMIGHHSVKTTEKHYAKMHIKTVVEKTKNLF
jgi:integrase/recombinase XerD